MARRAGLGPMAEVEACIGGWWVEKGEKDGDIWSKWASSATASASNLLKFSEKIALQKQCQAEETVAFEEVMMDFGSIQLQAQKLWLAYTRSSHYSGSLPNVNQIGCGLAEFQGPFHSPLDSSWSTRHHGLVEQVQRDPRRMVSPLHHYPRHIDSSPYCPIYLLPLPRSPVSGGQCPGAISLQRRGSCFDYHLHLSKQALTLSFTQE